VTRLDEASGGFVAEAFVGSSNECDRHRSMVRSF
jgi:hypothetical protein